MPYASKEEQVSYWQTYHLKNRDRILANKKKRYAENRDKINEHRRLNKNPEKILFQQRHRKYGITKEQFYDLLSKQGDCCAICGSSEPVGSSSQWKVDHDHVTGKVRGLLCNTCNVGLGMFRDDSELLKTASKYLIGVSI
jgi:hypothetical protein